MRVVSGSARGMKVLVPEGLVVRPTTDRVREAVFNSLGSMNAVVGASVIDVFAGSGAMGIEALSRGAGHCTFCELDKRSLGALRTNLAHTNTAAAARVVEGDSMEMLAPRGVLADTRADLAICDPPYSFDDWQLLLALLHAISVEVVVAESDRAVGADVGWREVRQRRYGGTVVTILERSINPDSAEEIPT